MARATKKKSKPKKDDEVAAAIDAAAACIIDAMNECTDRLIAALYPDKQPAPVAEGDNAGTTEAEAAA